MPINTVLISMTSMGYLLYGEANIVPYFLLCKAPNTLSGGKLLLLFTGFKKRRDRAVVGKNVLIGQPAGGRCCRCHLNGRGRLRRSRCRLNGRGCRLWRGSKRTLGRGGTYRRTSGESGYRSLNCCCVAPCRRDPSIRLRFISIS